MNLSESKAHSSSSGNTVLLLGEENVAVNFG